VLVKLKTFGILGLVVLTGLVGFAAGWALCRLDVFRPSAIPATSPESEKLHWVQHADPVADFRQHVEREHDMRFLSRYGLSFASEFPGLTDTPEIQQLVQQHGSRRLEAGSDVITSQEELDLQQRIGDYAATYNSMLLGYLECQK
jgi:hypothetical protein